MILRDDNDGPAIIDVEFHDIYRNRANRVVDDKGYTMGAMGRFFLYSQRGEGLRYCL